ncbi:MAG: acetylxylan esterase [Clostridia bacterium]|nr:acetylxylan esterase [Clostridia bacterium]
MSYNGVACHDHVTATQTPKLAFNENQDYNTWKQSIKEKYIDLLGLDVIKENACEPQFTIEEQVDMDGYTQVRFSFYSEVGALVPCYLLIPDGVKEKTPVAVVLQGHNAMGFSSSVGRVLNHDTLDYDTGRGTFAIQAVKAGFVALAIEQRGMGERKAINTFERRVSLSSGGCYYEAMTAITLGRTLIGERVWDISKAIDMLSNFDCCDTEKIVITGNSGGGTASYYAACFDERIKICAPSCGFCSYPESILKFYHCSCNYIPKAYKYFDMQDLSCLIAPRNLIVVAGKNDTAFLVGGVKTACQTVDKIYQKAGAKGNSELVVTKYGHFWDVETMWRVIPQKAKELGWKLHLAK